MDRGHQHWEFDLHLHRAPVVLPGGTAVTPVSFDPADPYERDEQPDFGLYLEQRWRPPWEHEHVAWPDFGVPTDARGLELALRSLLRRAREGESVELGCFGGHGRTGTALACLLILTGVDPAESVQQVRTLYCDRAIETEEQERFLATFGDQT